MGADAYQKDDTGMTALIKAAREDNADAVKVLCEHYISDGHGDDLDDTDQSNLTALGHAAWHGSVGSLKALLRFSVDVDKIISNGNTALQLAAGEGHEDVVEQLIGARASITTADKEQETALMKASMEGHDGVVVMLMAEGANAEHKNKDGYNALHYAVAMGHSSVARALLSAKADVNAEDEEGRTPLVMCAMYGQEDVMTVLLDMGAFAAASADDRKKALGSAEEGNAVIHEMLQAEAEAIMELEAEGEFEGTSSPRCRAVSAASLMFRRACFVSYYVQACVLCIACQAKASAWAWTPPTCARR